MARKTSRHPTELELEILKVLWDLGSASVRDVRDALASFRDLAYTSVMTTLNIMVKKGYAKRRKQGASYTYRPLVNREATTGGMLADMVDRVFDGSAAAAVLHLIETGDLDESELRELRALIRRKEKGQDS